MLTTSHYRFHTVMIVGYHCTVLHYIKHALMIDIYGANNLAPQCPNYTEIIT